MSGRSVGCRTPRGRLSWPMRNRTPALLLLLIAAAGGAPTAAQAPTPAAGGAAATTGGAPTAAALAPTPPYRNPAFSVDARVEDLLSRMTLEEKVGQMTQTSIGSLARPADVGRLLLGSVLSSGDDAVRPNTPAGWADAFDALQRAALSTRLGIPILYGVDSVHGFSHCAGTTIFPHNIGLGAARDPALVREIGRATALEMAGTGVRWAFAPCLAVVRDERWGRTYESFGEEPALVTEMAAMIDGLQQGDPSSPSWVLATAKHFIADGGTQGGRDQGDARMDEAALRAVHLPPYRSAVERGVGSVMASFSSWNGAKVHGSRPLLTDLLRTELGFGGIVVSDWKGYGQLPGPYAEKVRAAVNAGIDVAMAPEEHVLFAATLLREAREGGVPAARIDEAVRLILKVKVAMGLFEHPFADRRFLPEAGSAEHRALARRAAAESVVLLKNETGILPLPRAGARILVAGACADDLGCQMGGWSITWQGGPGTPTTGTTILQALRGAAAGSTVSFDPSGQSAGPAFDVAVAVVGERPYAEGRGDRQSLRLDPDDARVLSRIQAAGVPLVVVLVSGRPLVVTDELPGWKALAAAWLPGTEGAGVADVLFGITPPTGRLPVSWPRSESQLPLAGAGASADPLFPFGFGLGYP
jgi:beta-glucosidase